MLLTRKAQGGFKGTARSSGTAAHCHAFTRGNKLSLVIAALALQALLFEIVIAWSPAARAEEMADYSWDGGGGGGGDGGGFGYSDGGGDYGEGSDTETPSTQDRDVESSEESQQEQEVDESDNSNSGPSVPDSTDPVNCSSDGGDAQGGHTPGQNTAGTDHTGSDPCTGEAANNSEASESSVDSAQSGDDSTAGGGSTSCASIVGDPIDLSLADKVHVQVDYSGAGANPLRLVRVYHSNRAIFNATVTIPMGVGWRSYYDRSVTVLSSTAVRLQRPT